MADYGIENLFSRLPVAVKNTYGTLKDIGSSEMLYRYSYDASIDGQKLQKAIDSRSIEFGLTSSGKAIGRIHDYLHFLLGNGIVADVFGEYKNTVNNLMSMLVYKYSSQGKRVLHDQLFPMISEDEVQFDEIDFYCFVSCFSDKELIELISKYRIETIVFNNMQLIETAAKNLITYYKHALKTTNNYFIFDDLETKIKNLLALFRYVDISQDLVDTITVFILNHEFRNIRINDKIRFLDHQLKQRKKYSQITSQSVEDTLIVYLDRHISAVRQREKFDLPSTDSRINYYSLVYYIAPQENDYSSRRLSIRVNRIIDENLKELFPQLCRHYYGFVSAYQKKKLVKWANKMIEEDFRFDLFSMLIQCDAHLSRGVISRLKAFLHDTIEKAAEGNESNGIVAYPVKQPFEELDLVGYWCLINALDVEDFQEFLGFSTKFDFFCKYTNFDFAKFEVSWLINMYPQALEQIARDSKVKEHVRLAVSNALKDSTIATADKQRLQGILVNHFC